MGENLQIALGSIVFFAVLLSPFVINRVLKFKLELAKIRAQTEIQKEEIRARNQLDIEKLMLQDGSLKRDDVKKRYEAGDEQDQETGNNRERLRY